MTPPLHELWQIVLDTYLRRVKMVRNRGVCSAINNSYCDDFISWDERLNLKSDFELHRTKRKDSPYDWPLSDTESRINFIKERIEKSK